MKTALIVFASMLLSLTHAQVSLAAPTIYMQSATINGASNVVTISRVPVLNGAGVITYKDISMGFIVDTLGNVTFNGAALKIVASPLLNVGAFKQGTYRGIRVCSNINCGVTFKVGAPGIGTGGRMSGSITRITSYVDDNFSASWTSGPIAGHPHQAQLTAAGITSTALSWGVVGSTGYYHYSSNSNWRPGDLIGASQTGNQVTLRKYASNGIANGELTFTLCATANPC